jgi:hypothetical protein
MFRPLVDHVESSIERTDFVEFDVDEEIELALEVVIDEDEVVDDDEVLDNGTDDADEEDDDWVKLLLEL